MLLLFGILYLFDSSSFSMLLFLLLLSEELKFILSSFLLSFSLLSFVLLFFNLSSFSILSFILLFFEELRILGISHSFIIFSKHFIKKPHSFLI